MRARLAKRPAADSRSRMLLAEIAVDLSASRAILARAARLVDEQDAALDGRATDEDVLAVFGEVQAAKAFVNETGTRVVDRALALSGGAGYVNGSAARTRLPRCPRGGVHASAGRQPRVRRPRRPRARPEGDAAMSGARTTETVVVGGRAGRPRAEP